nr:hypothetical protein [Tanacetum cinerariifolium]
MTTEGTTLKKMMMWKLEG